MSLSTNPTITILGSGTALNTARRGSPGYLLSHGSSSTLLDCGSGTLRQLAKGGVEFQTVSRILLSHVHVDHVADLVPLLFARRNPDLERVLALEILGWPGFAAYYEALKGVYGRWVEDKRGLLTIGEIAEGVRDFGDFRLKSRRVAHVEGSLGFRIEFKDGPTLSYSGDSDVCPELVELGRDADVYIVECSFPDHLKVKGHLTPGECGRIARESGCKKLVLSHFYPICDQFDITAMCAAEWDGKIVIAEDGMVLAVGDG
jgi:ribonuclease BN (tRNA processing enzyme)